MEDLYRFNWPMYGIEIAVEAFHDRGDDIATEIIVSSEDPRYQGRLYSGRLLLVGPNSRRDVQRALMERVPDVVDWSGVLEQVCMLSRERFRRGEPPVRLADVQFGDRNRFLLPPFVPQNAISILYGDGATAKSLMALKWCVQLSQQGIKSLYLDWEDDAETHAERLVAICAGLECDVPHDIFYQRRSAPMPGSLRDTRRFVAENEIGHVVVDSVGMAAGDPMDHSLVLDVVRTARALNTASTLIHHLPKDSKDKTKPFGSVYASNEARLTWLAEKAQEEDSDELAIVLTNYKHNRGRLFPKQAFRVQFLSEEDLLLSVSWNETEIGQLEAFRSRLPQYRLILDVLKANGALSVADIQSCLAADGIDIPPNQIRTICLRYSRETPRRPALFARIGEKWGVLTTHVAQQP